MYAFVHGKTALYTDDHQHHAHHLNVAGIQVGSLQADLLANGGMHVHALIWSASLKRDHAYLTTAWSKLGCDLLSRHSTLGVRC